VCSRLSTSTELPDPTSKDILDIDKFWTEELLKANKDRLFGCAFDSLDGSRSGDWDATINGLHGSHAYSVLRAVEVKGKRFLVVRNPWGQSEWTGPWADGSKQWTAEWLAVLPELGHTFGDDGQFVMECTSTPFFWSPGAESEQTRTFWPVGPTSIV
jgi:hypothetical protein